jgi:hypothetical protein
LVEIEFPGAREWFLASSGGGTEVQHEEKTVTVITPESPMGSQLIGSRVGGRTAAVIHLVSHLISKKHARWTGENGHRKRKKMKKTRKS